MEIIEVNKNNIDNEHICCIFLGGKSDEGILAKKELMRQRFDEGYKFKKLNIHGKVFIDYVPAENAWAAVDAPNYMFIRCLWVSGKYKKQGYAKQLLQKCFDDAKDMNGVIVITTGKKKPFFTDKKFFIKQGFELADTAPPYFELLVKKNKPDVPLPKFKDNCRLAKCDNKTGLTFYYSDLCPYITFYLNEMINAAKIHNIPYTTIKIKTKAEAQNMPVPFAIGAIFYEGDFLTHEIMTQKGFEKILTSNKIID